MNEPKDIFSRWSQRKRDVAKAEEQSAPSQEGSENDVREARLTPPPASGESAEPFDLSKLPPIDSIMEGTDIRDFLKTGVPEELRRAALRRAWVTDPAIRDFVGLQENDWDFNNPNTLHGFGPIGPEHDVKEMVAQVFGKRPTEDGAQETQIPRENSATPPSESAESVEAAQEADQTSQVVDTPPKNIATQQDNDEALPTPQRHGSAMPT